MNSNKMAVPDINERDYEFMLKVKEAYEKSKEREAGSIRAVASEFNLSRTKVRKILVTLGVIESDITEKALSLKNQGKSLEEISKTLGCSAATVSTYLPYDTVIYNGEEKSSGAIRLELYRERNKHVAEKQMQRTGRTDGQISNIREKNNRFYKEDVIMINKEFKAMKLRLSLNTENADMETLRKYGKVKEGITREVLVPADMTLHALHFVIQKVFGWQNSHLHRFMLPKEIYNELTGNSFMKWADYCGIYFRFPSDDFEDIYWDDDYDESVSPNTWMRRKYTGPYQYYGVSEHFMEARKALGEFIAERSEVRVSPGFSQWTKMSDEEKEELNQHPRYKKIENTTCEEMSLYFLENGGLEELLERLYLTEILGDKEDETRLVEMVEEADERFSENTIEEDDDFYWQQMTELDGTALPLTQELKYEYDYGDGWEVKIELIDEYYGVVSPDYSGKEGCSTQDIDENWNTDYLIPLYKNGVAIEGELGDQVAAVISRSRPVCVAIDGLAVLDDVGGVGGYCEMLECIHGKGSGNNGYDDPEEMREWARMQGWTGRMNRPQTLL